VGVVCPARLGAMARLPLGGGHRDSADAVCWHLPVPIWPRPMSARPFREEYDELPDVYDRRLWEEKVERTFQFMFERYPGNTNGPLA
jgi:hypothetical protein